jgi:hypothetical protein
MATAGLRHVVLFRWKEDTSPEDIAAIEAALATLPVAIPELVAYRYGRDAGLEDGSWDFAVVADVASVEDYVIYRDHPAHQAAIIERIRPHVAERAAVQLHLT